MLKEYNANINLDLLSEGEIEWFMVHEELNAIDNNESVKNKSIRIGDRVIRNQSHARNGIIGLLNKMRQKERQETYWERVKSGEDKGKISIVAEGDSWFNYPTALKEVIDHLFDDFSIFSVGYGGDWLANIYAEEEYLQAIRLYKPQVLLLSGGGNDLVGGRRMLEVLRDYTPGDSGEDLIVKEVFDGIIEDFKVTYRAIFEKVFHEAPAIQIICHSYDYPYFEGKDKSWFGKPFRKRGIDNIVIQNEIGKCLIDRFHTMIEEITAEYPNVHYIDNRGLVPRNRWKNELHPDEQGFKLVAEEFGKKIREVVG